MGGGKVSIGDGSGGGRAMSGEGRGGKYQEISRNNEMLASLVFMLYFVKQRSGVNYE